MSSSYGIGYGIARIAEVLAALLVITWWFAGIALAQGFWSTAVGSCFPPYAMYLVVKRLMQMHGLL